MTDILVAFEWIAGMAFAFWCGWYSMQAHIRDLTVSRDNLKNMLGTELKQRDTVIGQQEGVIAALEAERNELLDTLCNTIDQACDSRMYAAGSAFPGSTHDSMALTAYAEAMFLLERHGRFVIEGDFGRRVIGHFVEVKP